MIATAAIVAPLTLSASFAVAKADVGAKVVEIIAHVLQVEAQSINSQTNLLNDLGMDRLAAADLNTAIEEAFNIAIPLNVFESFHTVGDIIYYVQQHTS